MPLAAYIKAIRDGWVFVASLAVAGLLVAGVVHLLTPKEYRATTSLFVSSQTDSTSDSAYQGGLFSEQRVKSYAELTTNDRVRDLVNGRMLTAYSAPEFRSKVTASSQLDSVVLTVSASDENPIVAANLANNVGVVLRDLVNDLERPDAPGATQRVTTRIVDAASVPEIPTSLRLSYALGIGLLIGLLLGLAAAVFRTLLDTTVRTDEDLKAITHVPNLAVVARSEDGLPFNRVECQAGVVPESYRQLRTALQFVDIDQRRTTIVISSAVPGEGKSTSATNLSVALSASGSRILVIDADLRRPKVAEAFGLESNVGLTSVLTGRVELDAALQQWGRTGLSVLTSGPVPPNPSELLGSMQMKNLLNRMRARFDYVILDSPPILPVADTSALAHNCDGVIVVARYGATTSSQVARALDTLTNVSATILGTVLTVVPTAKMSSIGYKPYDSHVMPTANENLDDETAQLSRRLGKPADSRPTPRRRA